MCVLSNVCVSSPGDTSNPGAWAEFRAAGADIWVQANAAAASEAAVGSGEQAKGRPRWAQAQIRQGAREPEEQLLCRDGQTCQEAPDILGERCTWQPYHSIPKHYLFCSRLNIIVCIIGLLFTIVKRTSPPTLGQELCQWWEEVPAAHPEPAEERAQQLPGVPETRVQAAQGATQRGLKTPLD